MKNWGSALFPLSLLLALAALTFWLRYATELSEPRHDGKHRHDPDYIVNNALLSKFDKIGRLHYTLKADEIRHYPDDDTTDLVRPDLTWLNPKRPVVTLRAEKAHVSQDGDRVDLYNNVRVNRAASRKEAALVATTDNLVVFPDQEKAFTKSAVLISQGPSWAKGIGMQMDNRARTYVLESQARAELASRHARKPKP